jgi:hypothetical protein
MFSLDFDGGDDHLIHAVDLEDFPQVFTLSCWCKSTATAANRYLFYIGDGTTSNAVFAYRAFPDSPGYVRCWFKIGAAELKLLVSPWDKSSWAHFAVTRDAAGLVSFYLDGVLLGSGTVAGTLESSTASVGSYVIGGLPWEGRISQFVVFDLVMPVADLVAYTRRDWRRHPACYLALNPGHIADSAAPGGLIHDWTTRGQDFVPTNMQEADLVEDAP